MLSNAATLKGFYNATRATGDAAISSDAALEIEGFENIWLLTKQFPWPELSPGGEIEIPGPLGMALWQPQQLKVHQQGQITLRESVLGTVHDAMLEIVARGGVFNARVYEGTPVAYTRVSRITDCFIQLDNPDRDWENRAQVLLLSGTIFFHYFGETESINIPIPGLNVRVP